MLYVNFIKKSGWSRTQTDGNLFQREGKQEYRRYNRYNTSESLWRASRGLINLDRDQEFDGAARRFINPGLGIMLALRAVLMIFNDDIFLAEQGFFSKYIVLVSLTILSHEVCLKYSMIFFVFAVSSLSLFFYTKCIHFNYIFA